jgi:hypothetical protein
MIGIGLYYQKIIEPPEGKIFAQNNYSKENIIEGEVGAAFSFSLAITNDVHMLDFNIIHISCQQCKRVEKLLYQLHRARSFSRSSLVAFFHSL